MFNLSLQEPYKAFHQALVQKINPQRIYTDAIRTYAYGTDASFYRLIPKIVIKVESEQEVIDILAAADAYQIPITFRAAGTSLSGQTVSDSVLVQLGENWQNYSINQDASEITLQPGILGEKANRYLAPFNKKIGPDPATLAIAKIGGIAANNSSGMCCGTKYNSYNTMKGIRIIFADGSILDTRDTSSWENFKSSHDTFIKGLLELVKNIETNPELREKIRQKYRIKNTTGYSINALVDFSNTMDIISHLMIGSEGTLGFISEIVYQTFPDYSNKASAFVIFGNIHKACQAVAALKFKNEHELVELVSAVELFDGFALQTIRNTKGLPEAIKKVDQQAAALLIETRAENFSKLQENIAAIKNIVAESGSLEEVFFTGNPEEYLLYWKARSGLFTTVGAARPTGTAILIEDVAVPIEKLADLVIDLQATFVKHNYSTSIFGHSLEGNIHFVFSQSFSDREEIKRYEAFMDDVAEIVVNKYQGSLKAEHGTGRNMAPFVKKEWGESAYAIMKQIKQLFDPKNILNPGVIINDDPEIHIKNLKEMPAADEIVDKCIECGFCEPACPSKDLTLTPRQRITVYRELARLKASNTEQERYKRMLQEFQYFGIDTCAATGLCQIKCPVSINTGELIKKLRAEQLEGKALIFPKWIANHFALVTAFGRVALNTIYLFQRILGDRTLLAISGFLQNLSGNKLPKWNPYLPKAARKSKLPVSQTKLKPMVYFPSCIARTMGLANGNPEKEDLASVMHRLLIKGGYHPIYPPKLNSLCCGMPFESKGMDSLFREKSLELEKALLKITNHGEYPIICDTSPCVLTLRNAMPQIFRFYEPVEFIYRFLKPNLVFNPIPETIMVHITCSSTRMGLSNMFKELAELCADKVIIPDNITCCGFAGDKGFNVPELNDAALKPLQHQVPPGCHKGYSNSQTCEIGLSAHSGIYYRSLVYLVDQCT